MSKYRHLSVVKKTRHCWNCEIDGENLIYGCDICGYKYCTECGVCSPSCFEMIPHIDDVDQSDFLNIPDEDIPF